MTPHNISVTDNDHGCIYITVDDVELRSWLYESDDERRKKMLLAREYIEGWADGWDAREGTEQRHDDAEINHDDR